MAVRIRLIIASPSKDVAHDAWWPGVNVVLFDPPGVLDHFGIVVESDRLPDQASKPLAMALYLVCYLLHIGTELVDIKGPGFTDDGGNGLLWRCWWDYWPRTGTSRSSASLRDLDLRGRNHHGSIRGLNGASLRNLDLRSRNQHGSIRGLNGDGLGPDPLGGLGR